MIDRFYSKYKGIEAWHGKLIREVKRTGRLVTPFGRNLVWERGKEKDTEIKNYIVQGTGADIVSIARCSLHRRWKDAKIKGCLVNTVHDSIVADVPIEEVDRTIELFAKVFEDLPENINRIFKCNFDLETRVEISIGKNMYDLEEVKL